MNRKSNSIKMVSKLICVLFILNLTVCCKNSSTAQQPKNDPVSSGRKSIKLAILLDTSNSMDGLIDQAKSQLWSIVNELAKAKCDNTRPDLHIALYEYGNDNLPYSEGYIRMVTPLTTDLDQISEDLFSLKTNGGQEYCGYVIHSAINELDWSISNDDFQIIFIAGNEPFSQGNVSYMSSCKIAKEKGVIVNTIFCGDFDEGIRTSWKNGADITGGKYFSIEQNRKTVYIETPYDEKLVELNNKLNDTYISYGSFGQANKEKQIRQDYNAQSFGTANQVNRVISKSSGLYKNESWDLVDAMDQEHFELSKIDNKDLPEEMQNMNDREKKDYVIKKKREREEINKEINELNVKRTEYITQKKKGSSEGMLDDALLSAIKEQANTKNYLFD